MSLEDGERVSATTIITERVDPAPPPLEQQEPEPPRQARFLGGLALVLLAVALTFAVVVPLAGRVFG